ncbi:DUF6912 family protein [Nocardioides sp. LHG3406-4]|uniref:DUF6912 family protein n=1 Tax=Nocardioides sp. LHG3406-4 TaxID=2804575 RepID=UPI003CE9E21B
MSARVYVAATVDLLGDWHSTGTVPASADRVVAAGDDEESEYAALMTAADLSQQLLHGPGRRCVLVAETSGEGDIAWRDVVAVHVDTEDDADPDDDLAWFASQEIPLLL